MHALKQAVRALCVIPFATGLVDMVDGVGFSRLEGRGSQASTLTPY